MFDRIKLSFHILSEEECGVRAYHVCARHCAGRQSISFHSESLVRGGGKRGCYFFSSGLLDGGAPGR